MHCSSARMTAATWQSVELDDVLVRDRVDPLFERVVLLVLAAVTVAERHAVPLRQVDARMEEVPLFLVALPVLRV